MKRYLLVLTLFTIAACTSFFPYKGQSLDDLHKVVQNPEQYRGNIVSFAGEIRGLTEDIHHVKFVLKVEAPLYYYATGKDPLSYQLLLVDFKKESPQPTGIKAKSDIKILAKINRVETRANTFGEPIAVLHLQAIALSVRSVKKDFFHTVQPDNQLYLSWKAGKLFFKETPQQILARYSTPTAAAPKANKTTSTPLASTPAAVISPEPGLIFEEEEPFIVAEEEAD